MLFDIVYCDSYVVYIRCLFICNAAIQPGGGVRRVLGVNGKREKRVRGQEDARELRKCKEGKTRLSVAHVGEKESFRSS